MIAALSGFALIGVIVAVGWATARWAGLPGDAEDVLSRLVFFVLSPCLLFDAAAGADLHVLFRESLLVSVAAALVIFGVHAAVVRLVAGRQGLPEATIGALCAGYVNANYIGFPVATYVLGDAGLVVPIIMVQLLVITPLAMTLLEIGTTGRTSVRATLATVVRNPLIIATAAGAVVSGAGWRLPPVLADPVASIGGAAVPVVLIAFGMSLTRHRMFAPGADRRAAVVAVLLKVAGMPAVAFGLATALRLPREATYAVTIMAALPTAQNVFLYAQRFRRGLPVARDAIAGSTLAAAPALLLIALLFTA